MSLKKVHDKQPEKFEFTEANLKLAKKILEKNGKEKNKVINFGKFPKNN